MRLVLPEKQNVRGPKGNETWEKFWHVPLARPVDGRALRIACSENGHVR
jgi:hypothetical protein